MTDAPQPAAPQPAAPLSEAEDKQWASFAHLGGILSFVPVLIIWLVFKDRGPKTNAEGKEALNFQLTLLIGYIAGAILTIILIGPLIWFATWIVGLIFSIIGFTKVNAGESYRYPFNIRFIK